MASLSLSQPTASHHFNPTAQNTPTKQPIHKPSPFYNEQSNHHPQFSSPQPGRAPAPAPAAQPILPPPQTPAPVGTGVSPAFPNLPSGVMAGMWSPEMGIRFGAPAQMSMNSRISGPGLPANGTTSSTGGDADGEGSDSEQRRPMPGRWDPERGLRFS